MNYRSVALLSALIATMALIVPLTADADALSEDEIVVTPGTLGDVTIGSGQSKTVTLYVYNGTDGAVSISSPSITGLGDSISASSAIMIDGDRTSLLKAGETAVISITFSADGYADKGSFTATVSITARSVTSVEDPGVTETRSFNVTVQSVFVDDDSYNKFFGLVPNTLGSPLDSIWVTAAVTMVLWTIATIVMSELIIPIFTRLVGSRKTEEEKKSLTNRLTRSITAIMFVIALNECTQIVGASAEVAHLIRALSSAIYVVLGAVIAWQIYMFVVTAFLKEIDESSDVDGMDMSLLPLFKMIGELVITVAALCAALAAFGVDLASIMVSAGVVSLGITLGAQSTLNQFFSGIVLLACRPFKKDDFVQISGNYYKVKKVRLMYTEFVNWDNDQIVTIPNNSVSSATLVNLTKESPRTRVFVYIDVAYDSDLRKVKESLEKAARKHPHVITDGSCGKPTARLVEFADSGIRFKLLSYVDDFDSSAHYAGQIRELVLEQLTADGITVPYERIQVDVLSLPGHPEDRQHL